MIVPELIQSTNIYINNYQSTITLNFSIYFFQNSVICKGSVITKKEVNKNFQEVIKTLQQEMTGILHDLKAIVQADGKGICFSMHECRVITNVAR
ncbi:MAG TPA: hypothetical protein PKJ28_10065, partial [Bacteroidales bacterium]|nr:hypothetical protein [Bacteroidales bacterium]